MVAKSPERALITGVSGQDGSYMAELLCANGYAVYGTSRDKKLNHSINTQHLADQLNLVQTDYTSAQIEALLEEIKPSVVFHFAGQSYVGKSWQIAEETLNSNAVITLRFISAIANTNRDIFFYNASSSEIFNGHEQGLDENSKLEPQNPYGASKACAHNLVSMYKKDYELNASNLILFPHESVRRNDDFAIKKVVNAAIAIKMGKQDKLVLGNIDVYRDWGYAPYYMHCIMELYQSRTLEDICLCTGKTVGLRDIIGMVFSSLGLSWEKHVEFSNDLMRQTEPTEICGVPDKMHQLGFTRTFKIDRVIDNIIEYRLKLVKGEYVDYRFEQPFSFDPKKSGE